MFLHSPTPLIPSRPPPDPTPGFKTPIRGNFPRVKVLLGHANKAKSSFLSRDSQSNGIPLTLEMVFNLKEEFLAWTDKEKYVGYWVFSWV